MVPQCDPTRLFALLIEVVAHARLGDTPLCGRTHAGATQKALVDEAEDLINREIEKLGNLRKGDVTLRGVVVRHVPIMALSARPVPGVTRAVDNLRRVPRHRVSMTAMSSRTNRAVWADARFLIGLALVVASVAGVWWVVSAARSTTPVAVAATVLLPGTPVSSDDVRWVDVALGEASDTYLTSMPDDATTTRPVAAGELIPASAVIARERSEVTTVVVTSPIDVASTVTVGSAVEVWMSPVKDRAYDDARLLIESATVGAIRESTGLASGGTVTLELIVNRDHVSSVLDAQASKAALWVVPLGGVR